MTPSALVGRDGRGYSLSEPRWRGSDGSPLLVSPQPGIARADVDTARRSHWRYAAALPLALRALSLGEGLTPLLELAGVGDLARRGRGGTDLPRDARILVKCEGCNPTASFKDRGASVMLALLAHQGVGEILEDSSGNGGAAVAAYAAAGGVRATILAPESTAPAKTLQSRMSGARVELVPGSRQATAEEALRRSSGVFYASHNWHPFFLQGTKLLAYELWEDLDFRAPDAVLMPAGAGSLVLGCSTGFSELLRAGAIERLPRLLAVQPEHCGPLARAFAAGAPMVAPAAWRPTIAEGTAIARPVRDREVLQAVRASGGAIVAVPEAAIAPAVRELALRGLYVEPTAALAVAALPTLLARRAIAPRETVVAVLTGSGLKASHLMERILEP